MEVKDLQPDVFAELLTFIYTGNTPNLGKFARELLAAADKYQVELLKTVCSEKICGSIDVNNCIDLLVIGDTYNALFLKQFSLRFIAKNVESVCETRDWRERLLDHPTLMADVIGVIGKKKVNKSS